MQVWARDYTHSNHGSWPFCPAAHVIAKQQRTVSAAPAAAGEALFDDLCCTMFLSPDITLHLDRLDCLESVLHNNCVKAV